ncbi:hypothetical protein JMJ06_002732, partial [Enterococcus faecalis]|nr:hypothetical protein [Enterococcus faecalis]
MEHSTTIKKLRVSKNITQQQLSQGICSRSTLAVFETKGNYISADFLFRFLDRMNIRVDEYVLYLDVNETDKNKAIGCLRNARINKDGEKLFHLAEEFKTYYLKSLDIFWLCYAFKAEEFAVHLMKENFDYQQYKESHQEEINIMTDYLMKVNYWGEFELNLLGNLMQYLSSTYINIVLKKTLNHMDLTTFKNQELVIKLFLNASIHFVEAELLDIVPTFLNQIDPFLSFEQLHWQILSRFIKDLCQELK